MCGIVGLASTEGQDVPAWMSSGVDVLQHRGPDSSGLWSADDGRAHLGHRRLAVIELSPRAHQPMMSDDGQLALTFNGELYNYRELRARLEAKGHSFVGGGDTEVLLQAYREWGLDCLQEFVGMFAFALVDAGKGRLLLARDRAGEKPLFWRPGDGEIRFASELKALLADRTLPRVMDPAALDRYLAYGYVWGHLCLLQGFRKLEPGTALTFDLHTGDTRTFRWWSPPLPEGHASPGSHWGHEVRDEALGEELTDGLEALLLDSVEGQLVSDVPVGVLLSGGVDSSLITAMAAARSPGPLRTFTVTFPGDQAFNEAPLARMVAEHCGTEHHEVEAPQASPHLLPLLARQFDEPIGDASMVPTYLVSRAIREHATVALGGDGGDELFGGYPHYQWLLRERGLREAMPGALASAVAGVARALPTGVPGRHRAQGLPGSWGHRLGRINLLFDRKERLSLSPALAAYAEELPEPPEAHRWPDSLSSRASPVSAAMLCDFQSYLPDDLLTKVDRSSMLASLEVRAPFLDHRVVEFAFRDVPVEWKVDGSERKLLLRKLAQRWLPPELPLDRKQGFSIPLSRWFQGPWETLLMDAVGGLEPGGLDKRRVLGMVRSLPWGLKNANRLFALLMLELWRREYDVAW